MEGFGVQTPSEIWSAALRLYQRPSIKLSGQNKCMVHIEDEQAYINFSRSETQLGSMAHSSLSDPPAGLTENEQNSGKVENKQKGSQ